MNNEVCIKFDLLEFSGNEEFLTPRCEFCLLGDKL